MIKNIVFDFGDVFINLDKQKFAAELRKLGISQDSEKMLPILHQYEMGIISSKDFIFFFYEKLNITPEKLTQAWNSILLDFPENRLSFIKELAKSKKYRLFLLSNTNDLHISWIQNNWGMNLYEEFKSCFEQFYLSHEINLRKPNAAIYEFLLEANHLIAEETFFIDDTQENTIAPKSLGIHVWNLIPGKDDLVELFTKNII
jgi:putative hydrolase of the HAD superfamily